MCSPLFASLSKTALKRTHTSSRKQFTSLLPVKCRNTWQQLELFEMSSTCTFSLQLFFKITLTACLPPSLSSAYEHNRWITNIAISFPPQLQNSGIKKPLKRPWVRQAGIWKLLCTGTRQPKYTDTKFCFTYLSNCPYSYTEAFQPHRVLYYFAFSITWYYQTKE